MCAGCAIPIAGNGFVVLLAARVVQGAGFSVATTVLVVMTAEAVPARFLARGMGYRGLGVALATAVGPSLALVFVELGGGAALFGGFGLMTVLSMVLVALSKSSAAPRGVSGERDCIDGRAVCVEGREERAVETSDSRFPRLVKYFEPAVFAPSLVEFCRRMITGMCTSFIILYAVDKGFGDPGAFFIVASGTIIACRLFGGRILDGGSVGKLLIPVLFVCMAGFLCLLAFPCEMTLCLAGFAYGATEGLGSPFLNAMSIKLVSHERWGVASGNFYLAGDAGVAIGAFACGFAIDLMGYNALLYGVIASALLACVVAARVLKGRSFD